MAIFNSSSYYQVGWQEHLLRLLQKIKPHTSDILYQCMYMRTISKSFGLKKKIASPEQHEKNSAFTLVDL